MTEPNPNIELTTEHQEMVRQLLDRIAKLYSQTSAPVGGWTFEALNESVRAMLTKAENSIQPAVFDAKLQEYVLKTDAVADVTSSGVVRRGDTGQIAVPEIPVGETDSTSKKYVDSGLDGKANASHQHEIGDVKGLQTVLSNKANTQHSHNVADITNLQNALNLKAAVNHKHEISGVVGLQEQLDKINSKADLSGGKLVKDQLPTLSISDIPNLAQSLSSKISRDGFVVTSDMVESVSANKITGLDSKINAGADARITAKIQFNTQNKIRKESIDVDSLSNLTKAPRITGLNTSVFNNGDIVVVESGDEKGTYWWDKPNRAFVKLTSGDSGAGVNTNAVTSVAGRTGDVVLKSSDITDLSQNYLQANTGLQADLKNNVYAQKTTAPVYCVYTSNLNNLSGAIETDGVTPPYGSVVLVAGQTNPVDNGIYVVNRTAWTRTSPFSSNTKIALGSLISIRRGNSYAGSVFSVSPYNAENKLLWVGTVGESRLTFTQWLIPSGTSNIRFSDSGFSVTGDTVSLRLGNGLSFDSSNRIQVSNNSSVSKYVGVVPGGSRTARITHNLNSRDVTYQVYDSNYNAVLVGATINTTNYLTLEFGTAPASGQYKIVVIG